MTSSDVFSNAKTEVLRAIKDDPELFQFVGAFCAAYGFKSEDQVNDLARLLAVVWHIARQEADR